MKEVKPTAEEFLKSKGWDESRNPLGGALFKGIVELLEEYARLKPYDPNNPRFPSADEIHQMIEHYKNLEGPNCPDGSIYVYAGIEMVKTWLKEHGLL
jgi:hypothetical protein